MLYKISYLTLLDILYITRNGHAKARVMMKSVLSSAEHGRVLGHFGHGHFGLGRFGLDISATDVSATENAEGGRFGHNHKFWVWDVCMHFIIF